MLRIPLLLIKILLAIIAVISLFFAIYIFTIIKTCSGFEIGLYDNLKGLQNNNIISTSLIEKDSFVRFDELRDFFLFTSSNNFDAWYSDKVNNGSLSRGSGIEGIDNSNDLFINADIEIPKLQRNDCTTLYCYQQKVPFEKIPSVFWRGLIGIEDYRFLDHFGIDFKSIFRAIVVDLYKMKLVQGGSTLTQQLVKNIFLNQDKTIHRKFKELILSIYIEHKYSKEQILEAYFNEVVWGSLQNVRIKGIYAAALFYFNLTPSELDAYQASILISMLKGPAYYHPIKHQDRLRIRTNIVYRKLIDMKLFPGDHDKIWNNEQWDKWKNSLIDQSKKSHFFSIWRVLAEKQILDEYSMYTFNNSVNLVLPALQEKQSKNKVDIGVKSIIGGISDNVANSLNNVFSFYSKFERDKVQSITEENHQIGSTIKPIVYRYFLDREKSLDLKVSTDPITINLKSGKWSPKEAHKISEKEITLAEALLKSYNRPIIRIANEIGFEQIEKYLLDFFPQLLTPLKEYPSELLGALEIPVYDLFVAYQKFITKECKLINLEDEEFVKNIANKSILYLLSDPSKTTISKVVGPLMKTSGFFGKTGTTNNGNDNWFIFFDGNKLGVIWVGVDGVKSKNDLFLYGSTTAYKIFEHFVLYRGKRFNDFGCIL